MLVKFATRRSKIRGTDAHNNKMLRRRPRVSGMNGDAPDPGPGHGPKESTSTTSAGEEGDDDDWTADGLNIYIADDLTKRANLANRIRVVNSLRPSDAYMRR